MFFITFLKSQYHEIRPIEEFKYGLLQTFSSLGEKCLKKTFSSELLDFVQTISLVQIRVKEKIPSTDLEDVNTSDIESFSEVEDM